MRIAAYNSFYGRYCAESELARRICLAAKELNWEAIETNSSAILRDFKPDFVLAMHFDTPKLTGFPTYGCMWNPPTFFSKYKGNIRSKDSINIVYKNVCSYDAYLSSSLKMDSWIEEKLRITNKKYFTTRFYTSCNQTVYQTPNLDNPHLVYIGANWDGNRFEEFFKILDNQEYTRIYGNQKKWNYLNNSYKGTLPFDGRSVLNTLNEAGVGLCLHTLDHTESDIPSMRIFEIVASGAIAICGKHSFIEEAFGNSVLYIDTQLEPMRQVEQITEHIAWIVNNKKTAIEMSYESHRIFIQKYSLEKLLTDIIPHHQKLIQSKGFTLSKQLESDDNSTHKVQFIIRVGDRKLNVIKRALDSIANQSHRNIELIIVKYKEINGLSDLLNLYSNKMRVILIESKNTGYRSTQLLDGLNALDADYFAILDDDDLIHINHVSTLINILRNNQQIGVAYGGVIRVWEAYEGKEMDLYLSELSCLAYFETFSINKVINFEHFITSNCYIARKELINEILNSDPKLTVGEDYFLLLHLCGKTDFLFSYEVTSEFYLRNGNIPDNAVFDSGKIFSSRKWLNAKRKILRIFNNKEFKSLTNDFLAQKISTNILSNSNNNSFYLTNIDQSNIFIETKEKYNSKVLKLLRNLYLIISRGGIENTNPNLFERLLINLKTLAVKSDDEQ
jgi:glycosyltransferase involved in cell wall biosynthesis